MRSIHDCLRDSQPHLPEAVRVKLSPLFADEERLAVLSTRLLVYSRQGVPAAPPPPHFAGECTPPAREAFAPFESALVAWHEQPEALAIPVLLAEAITACGIANLLVLLGQRQTPASLLAFPPPREKLLGSAMKPHSVADRLSVAGRALAKHAPRSSGTFWGAVTGGPDEKNAAARSMLTRILDEATWWNIFGHYKHEHVFEARVASGHGARWGHGGDEFIGFLEPFVEE